jgi:ABC-type nitrate/sulfonate/bicarbonate transport system substrate-binding protein
MATKLRVGGVPEHFNYPWQLAVAGGAFEPLGISVEYVDYPGGTGAMADALRQRDIDLALMLTEGAVLDCLRGSGNRLLKVYVESPLTWGIHVAASSDLASPDAMDGRPVAISRYGSGSHLIAVVDAGERGFALDAMRFVVVDNLEGARRSLAAGDADVFLWEKHMTQPLVDNGEFRRIGERVVPWPAFVVSAHPAALDRHGDRLRPVLDIVHETAASLQTSADGPARIADAYGISVGDAAAWLDTVRWGRDYTRPSEALERVVAALIAQGAVSSPSAATEELWYAL